MKKNRRHYQNQWLADGKCERCCKLRGADGTTRLCRVCADKIKIKASILNAKIYKLNTEGMLFGLISKLIK